VIGFDDIPQAGWDAYRLTTFRQPVESLTGVVMDVLRRRKEHGAPPHALTTVPVELVVRSTVRGLVAEESA
jgi:DNA-binding LacI/PurR family transcriptional regulator